MTKKFSVIKLSETSDPITLCETFSHYEAKNRFHRTPLDFGEKIILRSHVNGDATVVGERDNGYCA